MVQADQFVLTSGATIGEIRMWGGYFPGNDPGPGDDMTVIFHADGGGGVPGAVISSETGVPTSRITTGVVLYGVDEYLLSLSLQDHISLNAGTYWVQIYNNTAGTADSFFWETGTLDTVNGLPGLAYATTLPPVPWYVVAGDLAFELPAFTGPRVNDCNENDVPDECDIADGTSLDCNGDGTPDECESAFVPCGVLNVKPGGCPNPLNRSSQGFLPVALAGTAYFDVTLIDVASVRLSRADGVGGAVAPNEGPPGPHSVFADVATPFEGVPCECHDLTGDGLDDLSMKFGTQTVVAALQLGGLGGGDEVELMITGTLLDGTPFTSGGDCIRIVPAANTGVRAKAGSPSQAEQPGFGRRMTAGQRP
jgi:hypothetical protein